MTNELLNLLEYHDINCFNILDDNCEDLLVTKFCYTELIFLKVK